MVHLAKRNLSRIISEKVFPIDIDIDIDRYRYKMCDISLSRRCNEAIYKIVFGCNPRIILLHMV